MSHNPLHMANNVIPNRFIVLNFVASYCIVLNYGKQQNLLKKMMHLCCSSFIEGRRRIKQYQTVSALYHEQKHLLTDC